MAVRKKWIPTVDEAALTDYRSKTERILAEGFEQKFDDAQKAAMLSVDQGFLVAVAKTNWLCEKAPPLSPKETAVLTFDKPKTCALLYDRVWGGATWWWRDIPTEVVFGSRTIKEAQAMTSLCMKVAQTVFQEEGANLIERIKRDLSLSDLQRTNLDLVTEVDEICAVHEQGHGRPITSFVALDRPTEVHTAGFDSTITVLLEDLLFFDEEQLSWDQVLEFREDPARSRNVRRFFRWLDQGFNGRSIAEIEDELGERLRKYDEDVSFHGLGRRLVSLESAYTIAATTAAGALDAYVGLCLGFAGVSLSVAKSALKVRRERLDVRRKNEDVALVIALRNLTPRK